MFDLALGQLQPTYVCVPTLESWLTRPIPASGQCGPWEAMFPAQYFQG